MACEVDRIGTGLENITKDYVANIGRRNIGPPHGRDSGEDTQINGGKTLEGAAEFAKRSPRPRQNNYRFLWRMDHNQKVTRRSVPWQFISLGFKGLTLPPYIEP